MLQVFKAIIIIFWIFDILNLPFMEIFDTTYPINTIAWILIFLFVLVQFKVDFKKE